jgi:Zn-finger nucleic acid-binding protein
MKCPSCNVNLVMTDRQGVEIDYCPECRGVWLDRGELDKIIERSAGYSPSAAPQVPPPAPSYPNQAIPPQQPYKDGYAKDGYSKDGYSKDGYYKKKKRDSFLDDLFDF